MTDPSRLPVCLFVVMLLAAPAHAALPGGSSQPHPAVCRVVVQEQGGEAFGSGTLIDTREQYGLVVTNWHVVRDAAGKIEVIFPSGFRSEARPLKLDETWDLAALVVWRPPAEPAALAAHPPVAGDRLTICGYGGGDYRAQTGRCTDYYSPEVGLPQELVELSVEARQGDSGGPIFNDRGELAGVLFGAGQGTTLGSFGGRVKTFLASLAPDVGRSPKAQLASTRLPSAVAESAISSRQPPVAPAPVAKTPRPQSSAVDPFLAAEQRPAFAAPPLQAGPPSQSVPPAVAMPASSSSQTYAPAVVAVSPSTQVADLQPATPLVAAPLPTPTPIRDQPTARQPATPEAASPPPGAVDWLEDGRNLLAIVGGAALLIGVMRAVG